MLTYRSTIIPSRSRLKYLWLPSCLILLCTLFLYFAFPTPAATHPQSPISTPPLTIDNSQLTIDNFPSSSSASSLHPSSFILHPSSLIPNAPDDYGWDIAVDQQGYIYIAGATASGDFPITAGAFQTQIGGLGQSTSDAFVAKLSPDGRTLIYSTFLGGSGDDEATGMVINAAGEVYLTGYTNSPDFPVQNAFQSENLGDWDTFVAKLSADGTGLVYSTYLGGTFNDIAQDITIDSAGQIYIVGNTTSLDFPTVNPLQAAYGGYYLDGFITKLAADGSQIVYSTYLGGNGWEVGYALAVDTAGDLYISGNTTSTDFPVVNAFQSSLQGNSDAFVAKLANTGNYLIYSTYLGGTSIEAGRGIVLNQSNHAFIIGQTQSSNFPIVNGFQPIIKGAYPDIFVAKLLPDGSDLSYSTYLGGSRHDLGIGISLDADENMYLTGATYSLDFPTVNPIQATLSSWNAVDLFAAKLTADGSTLSYSTYLGGQLSEYGYGVTVDQERHTYLIGSSYSLNYPLVNPMQAHNAGGLDIVISRLSAEGSTLDYSTYLGGSSAYPAPTGVTITSLEQATGRDHWLLYLFIAASVAAVALWLRQFYLHLTAGRLTKNTHG